MQRCKNAHENILKTNIVGFVCTNLDGPFGPIQRVTAVVTLHGAAADAIAASAAAPVPVAAAALSCCSRCCVYCYPKSTPILGRWVPLDQLLTALAIRRRYVEHNQLECNHL